MPVLPDVGSTMVPPGFSSPEASAASTILTAMRSLELPPGLRYSTLAATRPDPGCDHGVELDQRGVADEVDDVICDAHASIVPDRFDYCSRAVLSAHPSVGRASVDLAAMSRGAPPPVPHGGGRIGVGRVLDVHTDGQARAARARDRPHGRTTRPNGDGIYGPDGAARSGCRGRDRSTST